MANSQNEENGRRGSKHCSATHGEDRFRRVPEDPMNKFLSLAVASAALCLFFASSQPAQADSFTMTLTGTGSETAGPYSIYPYYFTIAEGGNSTTGVSLMCISFDREIVVGESWTVNEVTAGSQGIMATQYEEAAYLYGLASSAPNTNAQADAQWAAWFLFDPGAGDVDPANGDNITSLIAASTVNPSSFADYGIYLPVAGTQTWGGIPQIFVGVTPEPNNLVLLGTGLLIMSSLLYFKKRSQVSVEPQRVSA
jgi:hypothetical protein